MEAEVELKDVPDQPVLGYRFKTSMDRIGENIGGGFEKVFNFVGRIGLYPAGPPFTVYYDMEEKQEDIDLEVCVPVANVTDGEGDVRGWSLDGGQVASLVHEGAYDTVGAAYQDLMRWMGENGYKPSGPPRETYLVGPEDTDNPEQYKTEIVFPVEKS